MSSAAKTRFEYREGRKTSVMSLLWRKGKGGHMKKNAVVAALVFLVAFGSVASGSDEKPGSKAAPKPGTVVTVIGVLTKGVECQALREDKTGDIFTLTKKPKGFKNGDHVKVTGKTVEISPCQQGT